MFSNLKILVTNDDGIDSLGLKVLVEKYILVFTVKTLLKKQLCM